jgi:16S rRNA (cytidine1402-2'-O)-methyltransferase
MFETVRRGTLPELAAQFAEEGPPKGEIVVIIDRGRSTNVSEEDLDLALSKALERLSVRDAADAVTAELGLPRRQVYQRALKLAAGD